VAAGNPNGALKIQKIQEIMAVLCVHNHNYIINVPGVPAAAAAAAGVLKLLYYYHAKILQ
jgi:hypothetical protein